MMFILFQIQALAVLLAALLGGRLGNGWGREFHSVNRDGEGRAGMAALVALLTAVAGMAVGAGFYFCLYLMIPYAVSSLHWLAGWTAVASAISGIALFVVRERLDRKWWQFSFALEKQLADRDFERAGAPRSVRHEVAVDVRA